MGPQTLLCYLSPTCLPLLFLSAEELGPNISCTVSPTCLSFVVRFCLCAVLKVENMICLPLNPTFSPTSVSVLRPLVSCLSSNFFDYFLSYMYMVSWQAPIRRLMFPSSVWAQRRITFCYLLLVAGGMEWMVPSSFCGCISPLLCLLLLIYALPSFIISLNLYPCVVAPHQHLIFATWAERMVVISCNATRIDFYVASLKRPRKNFLVKSLSLNISSPACVWLLGGSVACSGEVGQGPVNYCPAFCIPLRLVCLLGARQAERGKRDRFGFSTPASEGPQILTKVQLLLLLISALAAPCDPNPRTSPPAPEAGGARPGPEPHVASSEC